MFWTLSFSGAGHLLPYHLGVATVLNQSKHRLPCSIQAIAGSSAGAIAATVMTLLSGRIEEYSDRFLQDRGHAFRNLQQMLLEEISIQQSDSSSLSRPKLLVICTTKCSDGKMHLFSFDDATTSLSVTSTTTSDRRNNQILRAVQASCAIPKSFHPFDMFSRQDLSYADEEGVEIDGTFHVDGGIAAPVPPTPMDQNSGCQGRIQVSPISGPSSPLSIRPKDSSLPLLPFTVTTTRCQPFQIRPSVQNVRAMIVSMGLASPEVLRDWHNRGIHDASEFVELHDQTR
ncbi:patatin-like phospholipase [Nitzschia inconspicua]|uniref:Patatin-like phospholipase n=1 Tax=Nitzschia inconspicua TaxID=303405 RepID=A0A9K3Q623_9STRA|nr:patatin-like phospholipase [Nitzschia inconspicua]